jgi:hypothetical protein
MGGAIMFQWSCHPSFIVQAVWSLWLWYAFNNLLNVTSKFLFLWISLSCFAMIWYSGIVDLRTNDKVGKKDSSTQRDGHFFSHVCHISCVGLLTTQATGLNPILISNWRCIQLSCFQCKQLAQYRIYIFLAWNASGSSRWGILSWFWSEMESSIVLVWSIIWETHIK